MFPRLGMMGGVTVDQDTWRAGVGVGYQVNDSLKLRFGTAYDKSPVQDEHRTPRLPDADRIWAVLKNIDPSVPIYCGSDLPARLDFRQGYANRVRRCAPLVPGGETS